MTYPNGQTAVQRKVNQCYIKNMYIERWIGIIKQQQQAKMYEKKVRGCVFCLGKSVA